MRAQFVVPLLLVGCTGLQYVPKRARVFQSAAAVKVAVVDVGTPDGPLTLLRITGTMSQLEDKVVACRLDESSSARRGYVTQLKGEDIRPIRVERERGGAAGWRMVLPEPPYEEVALTLDEEATTALDPREVIDQHARQKADGTLAALQDWNRSERIAEQQKRIDRELETFEQKCGVAVPLQVDWVTISDDDLRERSIASYCTPPHEALQVLCKSPSAREAIARDVNRVTCSWSDAMKIDLASGTVAWSTAREAMNQAQYARSYFLNDAPWSRDFDLAKGLEIDESVLCVDEKKRYVGLMPHERNVRQVVYGDGKSLTRVAQPSWVLSGNWFFDPREYNPENNADFRGVDLRLYSRVEVDEMKGTCELVCGSRVIPLEIVTGNERRTLLREATVENAKPRRVPYALARDRKGTYYYVDKTDTEEAKDFKLYRGPKGNLTALQMVNVVSDSSGDVFATKTGSLRLVIEKNQSFWVEGPRSQKLMNVPIEENWGVIYNELGVYAGTPFNTPCDDM